jgi:hypothetical protein
VDREHLEIGTGRHDLHDLVAELARGGKVATAGGQLAVGREQPVLGEDPLQDAHRGPRDADVGIAPRLAAGELAAVIIGDVHPAGEPDATVAHDQLAVGAEVGAAPPDLEQRDRIEPRDLAAGGGQRREEPAADPERPGAVDDHADLDTCLGALDQLIAEPAADPVVLPDVVLDVDVVLRLRERGGDRLVLRAAVGDDLDGLGAQRRRLARGDGDPRELLALPHRRVGLDLLHRADRLVDELARHAAAQLAALEALRADQAVDAQADDRQERQDEQPRDRRRRRAPLQHDHDAHRDAPHRESPRDQRRP